MEPVAFSGKLQSIKQTRQVQVVAFDSITNNVGNGYHASQSKFITPRSGVYQFSMSAISKGNDAVPLILYKNGQEITTTESQTLASYPLGTGLVLVSLSKSDVIELKVKPRESSIFGGFFKSASQVTFEGHLIT